MAKKKRICKKLRIDEYAIVGFEVRLISKYDWMSEEGKKLYDSFIFDAIEANGLVCGGGAGINHISGKYEGYFIVQKYRPQKKCPWKFVPEKITDLDRGFLEIWLKAQENIESFEVGPLINLEY